MKLLLLGHIIEMMLIESQNVGSEWMNNNKKKDNKMDLRYIQQTMSLPSG